ncbi:hypothetical protein LIER_15007 [Lithospermum erythrorhizon]|uniref:DUF4283 domain-containing protein n=1 Tax=Lithospermum erythrorhizon TaxID=34254 RepID=A0AAV3Q263_LITER
MVHWTLNLVFQSFEIAHANLWIQIHGIPGEYFSESNVRRMARVAGEIVVLDWYSNSAQALHYVRVKLRIPLAAPLVSGIFIRTLENTLIWVSFRYENIFRDCYHCGTILREL